MTAMTMQNADFSARIARIEAGTGSSKSTLFVGMDEVYRVDYHARRHGRDSAASNAWYPISVAMTFVVGALSDLAIRWVDFMTKGLPAVEADPGMTMVVSFFTALLVSLVVGACMGVKVTEHLALRSAGIIAGMVGWHNAVHNYPELFGQAFSPLWVGAITRMTEPHSLVWMGHSVSF
jgi:hypothetical protein